MVDEMTKLSDASSELLGQAGHVAGFSPPHAVAGEWLWFSNPFARGNLKTGVIELLPPIAPDPHSLVGVSPDERIVLVATWDGLWALELKEEGEEESP